MPQAHAVRLCASLQDWSEEEVQYLLRMVKAAGRRWATICEAIRHDGAVNGSTLLQDQDPVGRRSAPASAVTQAVTWPCVAALLPARPATGRTLGVHAQGQLRYKFKNLVRTGRLNVADYPKFPPGQEANGEESDSGSEYVSAR